MGVLRFNYHSEVLGTVSYTHLDVYKRQPFTCSFGTKKNKTVSSFCTKGENGRGRCTYGAAALRDY